MEPGYMYMRNFRRSKEAKKHQSSASLALWGGSTGYLWIPLTEGPVTREMISFDDIIM